MCLSARAGVPEEVFVAVLRNVGSELSVRRRRTDHPSANVRVRLSVRSPPHLSAAGRWLAALLYVLHLHVLPTASLMKRHPPAVSFLTPVSKGEAHLSLFTQKAGKGIRPVSDNRTNGRTNQRR